PESPPHVSIPEPGSPAHSIVAVSKPLPRLEAQVPSASTGVVAARRVPESLWPLPVMPYPMIVVEVPSASPLVSPCGTIGIGVYEPGSDCLSVSTARSLRGASLIEPYVGCTHVEATWATKPPPVLSRSLRPAITYVVPSGRSTVQCAAVRILVALRIEPVQ